MTVRLHVNIDHVATLRRLRDTPYPDVSSAARACLDAGAHGITMHLREDRRHVTDADVDAVRPRVAAAGRVFNLEMAVTEEMIGIASTLRPDLATLVPERRQERTTEGGLDVAGGEQAVRDAVRRLGAAGIRVSLFVGPDAAQIAAAARTGAAMVELHTGEYCHARGAPALQQERLAQLAAAARQAGALGLRVAAGHGLYLDDVGAVAALPEIEELNIGHGIVCRAVEVGMAGAVREMIAAMAAGKAGA